MSLLGWLLVSWALATGRVAAAAASSHVIKAALKAANTSSRRVERDSAAFSAALTLLLVREGVSVCVLNLVCLQPQAGEEAVKVCSEQARCLLISLVDLPLGANLPFACTAYFCKTGTQESTMVCRAACILNPKNACLRHALAMPALKGANMLTEQIKQLSPVEQRLSSYASSYEKG